MLGLQHNLDRLAGGELILGVGLERAVHLPLRPLVRDVEHRRSLVVNRSNRARVGDVGGEHFLVASAGFDDIGAGEDQASERERFFGAGVED